MTETVAFAFAKGQSVTGKRVDGTAVSGTVVEQHAFVDAPSIYGVMVETNDVYNCYEADLTAQP